MIILYIFQLHKSFVVFIKKKAGVWSIKALLSVPLPEGRCCYFVGWNGPGAGQSNPPSRGGEADEDWLWASGEAACFSEAGCHVHASWSSSESVLLAKNNKQKNIGQKNNCETA